MANLLNFLAFQAVWFVVILSAAGGKPVYGIVATLTFAIVQIMTSHWRMTDLKLLLMGLVAGMMLDTIWLNLGLISYAANGELAMAPLWIGCLWVNFMLTLNHSMQWLQGRIKLMTWLTLFAAPLSYLAGSELGAVVLNAPATACIALSLSWAVLVPMLMSLARVWRQQEQEGKHAVV
jgi:hypothetical protein